MKFIIYRANVIYGGGPSAPDFKPIFTDVSADFVTGFFQNVNLEKNWRTKEDQMGCYEIYKVVVSQLS